MGRFFCLSVVRTSHTKLGQLSVATFVIDAARLALAVRTWPIRRSGPVGGSVVYESRHRASLSRNVLLSISVPGLQRIYEI